MNKRKRLLIYEREKERLRQQNLPPQEYERKLRELARRLRL